MAFWTDKQNIIQPLRPYRFTLQETGVDLTKPGSPDDGGTWFWAKSVSKPSFEISQDEYQLINHKIRYPGVATWNDVTIKMIDYKEPNDLRGQTKSFKFYEYLKDSGYSFSGKDGISKVAATTEFLIQQLDADGNAIESWKLINPWIKNVEFTELSYDSDDISEITLTIAYDLAELTYR